jgi:hypothetical protein
MLYMGTSGDLPVLQSADIRVEEIEPSRMAVRQWFSLPVVRFVGAHTGCSCGFPSVIAEQPIEYYEGMPLGGDDREADLRSVRSLLALIRDLAGAGPVELYPVADGDEGQAPKGSIDVVLEHWVPETFFFNERFLYRVTNRPDPKA